MRQMSFIPDKNENLLPPKVKFPSISVTSTRLEDYLDPLSCISVNRDLPYLAFGTKSGRIMIYDTKNPLPKYYCIFTSHEPEFDYLKSVEITEKINCIEWLPQIGASMNIISANESTIKHWRLTERDQEVFNFNNPTMVKENITCLKVPKYRKAEVKSLQVRVKKQYNNAHSNFINSLVANYDQETFFSADDLQINMWNIDYSSEAFAIVNLKPDNLEDISEIITCVRVQPKSSSIFAYSLSTGKIRLCDIRQKSKCDSPILEFPCVVDDSLRFFRDIVSSISDIKYNQSDNRIISRDYLSMTEWDTRFGKEPMRTYDVQSELTPDLCYLYENNSIFDKFQCSWTFNDEFLVTGAYGNTIKVFDYNQNRAEVIGDLFCFNNDILNDQDVVYLDGKESAHSSCIVTVNDMVGQYLNLKRTSLLTLKDYEEILKKINNLNISSDSSMNDSREVKGSKKRKQSMKIESNTKGYSHLDLTKPILLLASDPRNNNIYIASDSQFISCNIKKHDLDPEDAQERRMDEEMADDDNTKNQLSNTLDFLEGSMSRKRKKSP